MAKCKAALRDHLPPSKTSEHGHELAGITKYAQGSAGARVSKALAALVGGSVEDVHELYELVQGFDIKGVQEASVAASKKALAPEGAEELSKASASLDFGGRLLLALVTVRDPRFLLSPSLCMTRA